MTMYLGEDLSEKIAEIARLRFGLDIRTTRESGMSHATDQDQLAFAIREGRCIVTRNGIDFERLTRIAATGGHPHTGIIVVPHSFQGQEFFTIAPGIGILPCTLP